MIEVSLEVQLQRLLPKGYFFIKIVNELDCAGYGYIYKNNGGGFWPKLLNIFGIYKRVAIIHYDTSQNQERLLNLHSSDMDLLNYLDKTDLLDGKLGLIHSIGREFTTLTW